MGNRKRIAILAGQADESYQSRFIEGFLKQAFQYDYDVCVFSMWKKYQDTATREQGDSNIFKLINYKLFDGIVILKDTIQTPEVAKNLEESIHDIFGGPVIVIEQDSPYFQSVISDGYTPVVGLVSHLIEHHGYTDIAFLSGKKWHSHAKQRLKAYRDAMESHGLTVREDRIIYGDFWYRSGELCVEQLLSKENDLPQAVACANDCMAIGLCEALEKRGIHVPEDIAVVGYDSSEEGQNSPKPVTSAIVDAKGCGEYAAQMINAELEERNLAAVNISAKLFIGESCGCRTEAAHIRSMLRPEWSTDISEEGFKSVNNSMPEDLLAQTSLTELINTIYTYAYQLKGMESFHLCLNDVWKGMENNPHLHCKNVGYTRRMIYVLRYNSSGTGNMVGLNDNFETTEILPELTAPHVAPKAFFFTPLFYEEECFGYTAISFGERPKSYDEIYRLWVNTVARGLECMRRTSIMQLLEAQGADENNGKFADAFSAAKDSLTQEERQELDTVENILDYNLLTYNFQPIVRTTDGEIYSYEALMRSKTDKKISPLKIIRYANILNRLNDVERATFLNVLSVVDSDRESFGDRKVFINSIPGIKLSDEDFIEIQRLLGKHSDIAVVELTEEAELSDAELNVMKRRFRELNVETAVDDYGTGYSNVSNLLRYMPNYVKIDRSLLSEIQDKPQKQHFVREIIEFCHDNGIMALAEGVETSEELRTVIHLGADLIQGYYTAKPSENIVPDIDERIKGEIRAYRQERQDGMSKHIYVAGRTNRVSLSTLTKDGNTDIVVPAENMVYKDITFIGMPGNATEIHMRIEPDYVGRLTLDNVSFANVKSRPCIELSKGADVTLILRGDNTLDKGGILVPEGARLTVEGEGNLSINTDAGDYYGIGNDSSSRHGDILFDQDGEIRIVSDGKKGVCIGSGLGGSIAVNRGKYVLEASGDMCVGIGAITGAAELVLNKCSFETDISIYKGVCIGSVEGNAKLEAKYSSLKCYAGGSEVVGIGTINGDHSEIDIGDANITVNLRADTSTCAGALNGKTDISIRFSGFKMENGGSKALALGGYSEDTRVELNNVDTSVKLRTTLDRDTFAPEENISIINGRNRFVINGQEREREVIESNI